MESISYELCPGCENEVKIEAKFELQKCPVCNETIKPCSLCVECKTNCPFDLKIN